MSVLKYPVRLPFFGSQYLKFNFKDVQVSDSFLNNMMEDSAETSSTNTGGYTALYFNQDFTIPSLENEPLDTGFSGAS